MYYVYSLLFGRNVYIGCTNNIRRRKDQHNENARKRKSKLGNFLADNGIVLKRDNFKIVFASESRCEALSKERDITKSFEAAGFSMLNDNYSENCSRKGKNIGNTSKDFVVIDCVNKTVTEVTDLRQYSLSNKINYKLLHATSRHHTLCNGRYCAFHKEDWQMFQDKEFVISGAFFESKKQRGKQEFAKKVSKVYEVMFPDGHSEIVKNLDKFAREHDLTCGTLHATRTNGKSTKGYKVLRRITNGRTENL